MNPSARAWGEPDAWQRARPVRKSRLGRRPTRKSGTASQPDSHGCWRTLDGAQAFLTVRSYVATARKHGINPLVALRRLFEGDPWMPAPAPP
jgi:hypothetical protein